mmetsp:Transcript_20360/g.43638  ORF Transcript_20360/g.43638 Transcript_20360/m.43638 type:complete len:104 (+) Transcript_20360:1629-1940(+)
MWCTAMMPPSPSSAQQITTPHHRQFKTHKPLRVLVRFIFSYPRRRRRTVLGNAVIASMCRNEADTLLLQSSMAARILDDSLAGLLLVATGRFFSERMCSARAY